MTDEMRPVPGYEGIYSVTRDGKIWSHIPGRWLTATLVNGYWRAWLFRGRTEKKFWAVHRLVALAWIPNPANLPEVNHKDGDKSNPRADNLEWVTKSQNTKHAWATGLITPSEKFRAARAANAHKIAERLRKLSPEQQRAVATAYASGGVRLIDLAEQYGVSTSPIRRAIKSYTTLEGATNDQP